MLIAASTTNGTDIDLHFGHTATFYIFKKEQSGLTLVEKKSVTPLSIGDQNHPFEPGRFKEIADTLSGCEKIYCQKIGDRPRGELEQRGFEVIEFTGPIADI